MGQYDTEMGGKQANFPSTHWSMLKEVRGSLTPAHRAILNLLIQRYWKPVYCYLRRKGKNNEEAKDLTQDFFTSWIAKEIFGKADQTRGRFRAFLLSCLDRFLINTHRKEHAKKRSPDEGILSIEKLATGEGTPFEPSDRETPVDIFNRTWATDLILLTLNTLEQECMDTEKKTHFMLFQRRIIEPSLRNIEPPPLAELAQELCLTEKQAANRLLTARRAYQRILREKIRVFALSDDDVSEEVRDLFQFLSKT